MQSFFISALLLVLFVGAGIGAIVIIRSWYFGRTLWGRPSSDRGDWESSLATYKNLRDNGVLSEEEYRKIRTLVNPHLQSGTTPAANAGQSAPV